MEFTAAQIADLIGGKIIGDKDAVINGVSPIENGLEGHLSFVGQQRFAEYLQNSSCSVLIVSEKLLENKVYKSTIIAVEDAYLSFQVLMNLYQEMQSKRSGVEDGANIHQSVELGSDIYVGSHAYISEKSKIGDFTQIYPILDFSEI